MSNSDSSSDVSESRLAAAVADSWVFAVFDGIDDRLSELGRRERSARLAALTRRVVTDSFVYRWLTTEPDPEVIVIDLRETYTVGPFVVMLDRIAEWLDAAATSSGAVAVGRRLLAEFRAAPVRLVGTVVALGSAIVLSVGAVLGTFAPIVIIVLAVIALVGLAGMQVTVSWTDIVDSRLGRAVVAVLEPPADGEAYGTDDRDE